MTEISSYHHQLHSLFRLCAERGASELLLTPGSPPLLRIGGEILQAEADILQAEKLNEMVSAIMNESQQEIFQKKGECEFSFGITKIARFLASVYRQRGSTACVFRLIPWKVPSPDEIGLPKSASELALSRLGLLLITGLSGSGRSTTWASLIDHINSNRVCHIITLEDPITFVHPHKKSILEQRQIGTDTSSFSEGLSHIFHQRPDVLAISRIKSEEEYRSILYIAETGKLVLAQVMTPDVISTIQHFILNIFPESEHLSIQRRLSRVLIGIISQRLLQRDDRKGYSPLFEIFINTTDAKQSLENGDFSSIQDMMETGKYGMQSFSVAQRNL